MMEQTKLSLAEQLKNELMERYGLREDQVRLQFTVYTDDIELGRTILEDHSKFESEKFLKEGTNCDSAYGKDVDYVWVHLRDGFDGRYINEKEDEDNE